MKPQQPFDWNGKPIKVGDQVRIVGVPDLSGMPSDGIAESLPAFEHLVGKYKRVLGFDEYGSAEFSLVMRHSNGERSRHIVSIEPFLLHDAQRRSDSAVKSDAPQPARLLP
jgi:hypothetical protein